MYGGIVELVVDKLIRMLESGLSTDVLCNRQ